VRGAWLALGLVGGVAAGACAGPSAANRSIGQPVAIMARPRIVTADEVTTEAELAERGERALLEQRWVDAAAAYRTLVSADPGGPRASEYLFDLGLALEGAQERGQARDAFLDLSHRFPDGPKARAALVRAATLDAYLEDWGALGSIGDALLVRRDIDDVDRIVALGARGLARVELGDDASASRDILDGLELGDQLHYGQRDVLPVAIAQLRFALGELRRIRSERIRFDPLPAAFLDDLDARCAGMLQAQEAYGLAVRSIDPHWAAMAGYRVGAMYRELHRDLMKIPPPARSKTDRQRKIFYAFMHVRYRVLLEKGLREIEQTIALGERISDASAWIQRARDAKDEMQADLAAEQAQIEAMPFTETEVKKALDLLQKRTLAAATAGPSPPRSLSNPK
jgi:hypothetical protein